MRRRLASVRRTTRMDYPMTEHGAGPTGRSRGFSVAVRWAVVGAFIVAAVVLAVRTAYEWDRGAPSQARGSSAYPDQTYVDGQGLMLGLINQEREKAGRGPLVLGNNQAAQLHAEASLRNCSLSHWGSDGLKPYMRYSLAGGYQYNVENASGSSYCPRASDGYYLPGPSIEHEIREAMKGLMGSPGHRANLLDPLHRKVNIGLAWDEYSFVVIQHFEGDYVEFDVMPSIEEGVLSMSGMVKGGVTFEADEDLRIAVTYDPPPHPLSRGQLARTYCYDIGLPVASLRPPLTGDWYYTEDEFSETYQAESCPDPYEIPPNTHAPRTPDEADEQFERARLSSFSLKSHSVTIPWITALEWTIVGQDFAVTADLGDVLDEHGGGVYTVVVWGRRDSEDLIVSEYSIFHEVDIPDTYGSSGR